MRWNVTYTISMGRHGNQRMATVFTGTEAELIGQVNEIVSSPNCAVTVTEWRKAFPSRSILLVEWSEAS